ncbi:MAG: hypothetical protein QXR89_00595 [Candidatus Bathyarchaeia archaeon]
MKREDILLSYIYLPVSEPNVVSPLQIMKGLFLLSKELKLENFYIFEPYLYGPCSFDVYNDLNTLIRENLLTTIKFLPSYWSYYKVTPQGADKSKKILQNMNQEIVAKMKEIKKTVISKGFIDLLRHIYEKYPEYAVNSIIDIKVIK